MNAHHHRRQFRRWPYRSQDPRDAQLAGPLNDYASGLRIHGEATSRESGVC
jgi:hypothetical protein